MCPRDVAVLRVPRENSDSDSDRQTVKTRGELVTSYGLSICILQASSFLSAPRLLVFAPTKTSRTNGQTRIPFLVAITPVRAQDGEAARHTRFWSVLRLTTSTWPSPCAIHIPVIFSFHIPDISGQAPRCLRWFSPWHDGESPERNTRFSADRAHAHMFTLSRTHLLVDFARVDGIVAYDTSHSCHAFSLNSRKECRPRSVSARRSLDFPYHVCTLRFCPQQNIRHAIPFLD